MLYVSSACIKNQRIGDSVEQLALHGFKNIELSGGTEYYNGYVEDLMDLKNRYDLNYILHNYFPPPKDDFILNLASLDDAIFERSIDHFIGSIELSKRLGLTRFGLHAGFFIDFSVEEAGKNIRAKKLYSKEKCTERFCRAYEDLKKNAKGVTLYVENNVLSSSNLSEFGDNPFMLTNYDGYKELSSMIDFTLLLDVAHLYVSTTSLGLDFDEEMKCLFELTDYIHISDNDGCHDQNKCFNRQSILLNKLMSFDWSNKKVTLETYATIDEVSLSQNLIIERLKLSNV